MSIETVKSLMVDGWVPTHHFSLKNLSGAFKLDLAKVENSSKYVNYVQNLAGSNIKEQMYDCPGINALGNSWVDKNGPCVTTARLWVDKTAEWTLAETHAVDAVRKNMQGEFTMLSKNGSNIYFKVASIALLALAFLPSLLNKSAVGNDAKSA